MFASSDEQPSSSQERIQKSKEKSFDPLTSRKMPLSGLYRHLDPASKEIRLITILPASDDNIRMEMETVSLNDSPSYEALSYVWGDATEPQDIVVNGFVMPVTTNLEAALRQFRSDANGERVCIWTDAICIDQANDEEKHSQMPMMKKIYEQASNVRMWLGPATQHTNTAFSHMEYAMQISTYHLLEQAGAENVPGDFNTVEDWKALGELFRNTYWRRRWVTQEFTSAKSITMHCGSHIADLRENPTLKIGLLMNYADKCHNITSAHIQELNQLLGTVHFESSAILAALNPIAQAQSPFETRNTVELDFFFRADCKDDKDRVYGILGLLPDGIGIVPNYQASVEVIFEDFAFKYMNWFKSFDLLYLAGETSSGLPSWVPDLRKHARKVPRYNDKGEVEMDSNESDSTRELSFLTALGKHYNASAGASWNIQHSEAGTLTVRGLEGDQVSRVFLSAESLTMQIMADRGQTSSEFKTEDLYAEIIQAMCVGISRDYDDPELPFRKSNTADVKRYDAAWDWKPGDDLPEGLSPLEAQLRKIWLERLEPNKFLLTSKGRIGRASGDVRVGDAIFVLAGSPLLVALRKAKSEVEAWHFVGCAYVHGMMDGEPLLAAVDGDGSRACDAFGDVLLK